MSPELGAGAAESQSSSGQALPVSQTTVDLSAEMEETGGRGARGEGATGAEHPPSRTAAAEGRQSGAGGEREAASSVRGPGETGTIPSGTKV